MKRIEHLAICAFVCAISLILGFTAGHSLCEPLIIEKPVEVIKYIEKEPEYESAGIFSLTAYCPCMECCGKTDGITASGTKATAGRTVAADTAVLPFGTEIYIGGKKYTVEDRGVAINGKELDIFFESHAEALQFGRQDIEVFVCRK